MYIYNSSTSTISGHLKKCVPEKVNQYFQVDVGTSESKKNMGSYIHNKTPYLRSDKACQMQDKRIARSIVTNMQPLNILESEEYLETYRALDPRYTTLPSRNYMLYNVILPMYICTRIILKEKLDGVSSIALTTDCWTCLANHSYMTLTCHIINEEMVLESFVLDTLEMRQSHTSENLLYEINTRLTDWGIKDKNLVFVSDNASDISKALRRLGKYPWLGCMAHNIHLIVQAGFQNLRTEDLVKVVKGGTTYLRKSSRAAYMFHDFNKAEGFPDLQPIKDVQHRWNSVLFMLDRFLKIEKAYNHTMVMTCRNDYIVIPSAVEEIKNIVSLLNIFKNITDLLSGENYPTASLIKSSLDCIKDRLLENPEDNTLIKQTKKLMRDKFDTRSYNAHTCQDLIIITCYLDPRFQEKLPLSTKEVLINKAVQINQPLVLASQIPCTQGQDMRTLSGDSIVPHATTSKSKTKSIKLMQTTLQHIDNLPPGHIITTKQVTMLD